MSNELPCALCWKVAGVGNSRGTSCTGEYRAPTWSWASIDDAVEDYKGSTAPVDALVTVKDTLIELVNPLNKAGPIRSAKITLEGCLFQNGVHELMFGQYSWGTVEMDSNSFKALDIEKLLFLPIVLDKDWEGIALSPHNPESECTYVRAGHFVMLTVYELNGKEYLDSNLDSSHITPV
jgi:hypothetical protein